MEQYLRSYRGAIILISHDVALLDALVSRCLLYTSFFVGESSFRRVPYPKPFTALVSVQIVNRHNAVLCSGGRCKKGINERPGTNNYRSATRSRNNATPP